MLSRHASIKDSEKAKLEDHAEYRKGSLLIVEGQRIVADRKTEVQIH